MALFKKPGISLNRKQKTRPIQIVDWFWKAQYVSFNKLLEVYFLWFGEDVVEVYNFDGELVDKIVVQPTQWRVMRTINEWIDHNASVIE